MDGSVSPCVGGVILLLWKKEFQVKHTPSCRSVSRSSGAQQTESLCVSTKLLLVRAGRAGGLCSAFLLLSGTEAVPC